MGISGVHVSRKETGNKERNISRAEASEAQPLVGLPKRSIILGEAESSLGLFPSFRGSEGF